MTNEKESELSKLHARLTGAEVSIESISKDVQQLTENLNSYAKETANNLKNLTDKIEISHTDLRTYITSSNKLSWGPIIAGFGVTISIFAALVGFAGSGYIRDMDRLEKGQGELHTLVLQHSQSEGHPSVIRQMESNTNAIKEADSLRKNANQDARLDSLKDLLDHLFSDMHKIEDRLHGMP